jgi:hypothetical protein
MASISTSPATPRADALAVAALALAAALAAGPAALADPVTLRHERPRFTLTAPEGFARFEPTNASPDLLDVLRRPGDLPGEGPMVLQVLHLDAVLPQRPLLPAERAELRRADGFLFADHVEHAQTLGFSVETLVGVSPLTNGASVIRFAAAVPLEDDAVLVVLLAPSHRAAAARAALRAVLASVRGPTTWETPARRWLNRTMRFVLLGALLSSIAYAIAASVGARRHPMRPRTRRRATASLALLWCAVAAWLCVPWREDEWLFAVQALGLAVTYSALAWRTRSLQAV